jgi:hypothetical protein
MTDVSVCQTEGFQAVWRLLRLFRNLQIMTHQHIVYFLIKEPRPVDLGL